MLRSGEGPVVGVDVMGRRLHRPSATAGEVPSSAEYPRAPRPNIYEVLSRATALGSWRAAERVRTRADVVIAPDLSGTGMFDFKRMDAIVEAGREAARAALEEAPHLVAR
jgi:predicted acylesterase/phospholipase RssA